jgi:hypothetical protein
MEKIKELILNQDQITYSQFTSILTERQGVKTKQYYTSTRHNGGNVPNDYFKPISLITVNFVDEKIL